MTISQAIQEKRLLRFWYDGYSRTVEPHTLGSDFKGHKALRAYQVGGGSSSGECRGWKMFHVAEMSSIALLADTFGGARQGYRRGDRSFQVIQSQL
jgi:predicted DNA-binding transcriptional regulator YafY